jgi:hypothetical protein
MVLREKKIPREGIVPRYPRHLETLNFDISRDTHMQGSRGVIPLGFLLEVDEALGITTKSIDWGGANTRRLETSPVLGWMLTSSSRAQDHEISMGGVV